ncbi:MurR/RpiR family transcriptional regulator [Burkholderia aenigmatica]|uniref:RpiR family transcriptional regulator n=1 Tax=Burkholderia aenigmatica TaxID=2015348 RepID=A0A228IN78_9BURK|nr:MurR/RpiR family transcriptional regulator [Burkholderia aenigmatica]OXI43844.1 RpiR family transcriptional regulator [Burkholderia aenigmatica]
MNHSEGRPSTVNALLELIALEYDGLSKRLKAIAHFIERDRDRIGLEGIVTLANRWEVSPSAIVRFAKQFGFAGFSEMQMVFREKIAREINPMMTDDVAAESSSAGTHANSMIQSIVGSIRSDIVDLDRLIRDLDHVALVRSVEMVANADAIWIAGARQSAGAAINLYCALQNTDKCVSFLSLHGDVWQGQVRSVRPGDVLIAFFCYPYVPGELQLALEARLRGAKLVIVADSLACPLVREAEVSLVVAEPLRFGFRGNTATIALAKGLFTATASHLKVSDQDLSSDGFSGS